MVSIAPLGSPACMVPCLSMSHVINELQKRALTEIHCSQAMMIVILEVCWRGTQRIG
jgi:hypothetical protein